MNAVEGERVAVMGHTMDGYVTCIFVMIATVWAKIIVLGMLKIISISGAGVV